jgi:hypothetical protein
MIGSRLRLGAILALVGLVVNLSVPALADADDPVEAAPLSEGLQQLLSGADAEGPVTEADRAYFEKLAAGGRRLFEDAVRDEWITSTEHLSSLLALRLPTDKLGLLMTNNCFLCHTDPESQSEDTLLGHDADSDHMNVELLEGDIHVREGLSCSGCHGGDPKEMMDHDFPDVWPDSAKQRREDRRWVAPFCGRCHSDVNFMRTYDAQLATDQVSKYMQSRHAKGLEKDPGSGAAECTSCHGVHGILPPRDPRSPVHPKSVPATCASCHADADKMADAYGTDGRPLPTDQYEQYVSSVHGRALLEEGVASAPACNDCHGNHASSPVETLSVSQSCRGCHSGIGILYDGSAHKAVFQKNDWPECGACHGEHAIKETDDAMLGSGPDSVCADCHATYATDNPNCSQTADYFHEQLTQLSNDHVRAETLTEKIAHKGLDIEPLETQLRDLTDGMREARSVIHGFDRARFDETTLPSRAAVARIDELVAEADAEFAWRSKGLFLSLALIAALVILIRIKLAQIERGQG